MTGNRTVRFGIIGFGAFAEKAIAPALRACRGAELVALQKRSLEAARAKAAEHGIPLAFESAKDLCAHPEVDAVFIASANVGHAPETEIAASHGKHVIVEKPMAMSRVEAERMVAVCASKGVRLMVAHKVRFSPLVERMRARVAEGSLGTIVAARADFVFSGAQSPRTWLMNRPLAGGGPVFDVGVHCLDTLRYVLDDEVVSVSAELQPPPTETETEHTAQVALTFSRGTIGSIFCSFVAPVRHSYIQIVGTRGLLSADDFTTDSRALRLVRHSGSEGRLMSEEVEQIDVPNLMVVEIEHFSDCIRSGTPLLSPGESGLRNQIVLDAIMECSGQDLQV